MSTLTKVFVVLLVVFSIAFTMMVIPFVAKTAKWKETAETYEKSALVAETTLRNHIAAHAAELATLRDTIREDRNRINELNQELQQALNHVEQMRSERDQAASDKARAEAMNHALTAQLDAAQKTGQEYRDQRNGLETRGIELEQRNTDLNDRVFELMAQLDVLQEQKRQFEQQIYILKQENEALASAARRPGSGAILEDPSGIALSGVDAKTPVAYAAVRGKVIEVDGNIVTISVGASDGVKEGMLFVVHRDGDYVGDVKISLVDPDKSAGRLVQTQGQIRVNDQVTDSAWLGASKG